MISIMFMLKTFVVLLTILSVTSKTTDRTSEFVGRGLPTMNTLKYLHPDHVKIDQNMFCNSGIDFNKLYLWVTVVVMFSSFIYHKFQMRLCQQKVLRARADRDGKISIIRKQLTLAYQQREENTSDIILSQALVIEKLKKDNAELAQWGIRIYSMLPFAYDIKNFEEYQNSPQTNDIKNDGKKTANYNRFYNMDPKTVNPAKNISSDSKQVAPKDNLENSKLLKDILDHTYGPDKGAEFLKYAEDQKISSNESKISFFKIAIRKFLFSLNVSENLSATKEMAFEKSLTSNQQKLNYIKMLKFDLTKLYDSVSNPVTTNVEYFETLIGLLHVFKKEENKYLKSKVESLKNRLELQENIFNIRTYETDFENLEHEYNLDKYAKQIMDQKNEINELKYQLKNHTRSINIQKIIYGQMLTNSRPVAKSHFKQE